MIVTALYSIDELAIDRRATFSAAGYAAARPTYPASLFRTVLSYHHAQSDQGALLDLGCGHGLIAREMSPHFAKVVGLDTSAGMVKQAASTTDDRQRRNRSPSLRPIAMTPIWGMVRS